MEALKWAATGYLLIIWPGGWPNLTDWLSLITPPTTPAVAAASTRLWAAGDPVC